MITDDCPADSEISPPIERHDALNLFIFHQIRGYAPFMLEQDDGTYIVHRGKFIMLA